MGKNSAGREARRAREEEQAREARVQTGSQDIRKMFDDKFNSQYYQDLQQALIDHYQPDIDFGYDKTKRVLEMAMKQRGLGSSTVFANKLGELDYQKGLQEQNIKQKAIGESQNRRSNILGAEDTVLGQLRSSGDMNAANASAAAQLSANSQMPPYSPLGALFTDFTAGLAEQANQERAGTNRYDLGISQWGNQNPNRYTRTVKG